MSVVPINLLIPKDISVNEPLIAYITCYFQLFSLRSSTCAFVSTFICLVTYNLFIYFYLIVNTKNKTIYSIGEKYSGGAFF